MTTGGHILDDSFLEISPKTKVANLTRARDENVTTGCHILDDVTPPNSGVLNQARRSASRREKNDALRWLVRRYFFRPE